MTSSAEEIAAKLRDGYAQSAIAGIRVLGSLAAETIEISHVPSLPTDGPWDGRKWEKDLQTLYNGQLDDAISGFQQVVEIKVVGDELHTENTFKGTLKDGTPLNHCVGGVMTVKDGKIVKGVTLYNAERDTWPALVKAMTPA